MYIGLHICDKLLVNETHVDMLDYLPLSDTTYAKMTRSRLHALQSEESHINIAYGDICGVYDAHFLVCTCIKNVYRYKYMCMHIYSQLCVRVCGIFGTYIHIYMHYKEKKVT